MLAAAQEPSFGPALAWFIGGRSAGPGDPLTKAYRVRRYEHFVIAPLNGAPGNEYRIVGGQVHFRVIAPGKPGSRNGRWRTLHANDLLLHLSLKTDVGKWLLEHLQKKTQTTLPV